jgi:uncharacterized membrane protein YfcA
MLSATTGIGGGVLLLALMASLLPPAALLPVHGAVQFGSNLGRAAVLRAEIATGAVLPFAAGAIAGIAAGGALAGRLPPGAVQIAVGLFVMLSTVARLAVSPRSGAPAGAVSSALTMIVGATGPFVLAWVRGLGLGHQPTVATHALLMAGQHGLKIAAFALLGFGFAPWAGLVAAMIASGFAGTLLGRRLLLRLPERLFRRALAVILVLAGARLVVLGATALLGGHAV